MLLPKGRKLAGVALGLVAIGLGALVVLRPASGPSLAELKARYRPPPAIPFPADNPFLAAKAELGRKLFFDRRLSGGETMSCATCHQPARNWTDANSVAVGEAGLPMARRAPTLVNAAFIDVLGWDGQFPDIESVTFNAITGVHVMNLTRSTALARIAADPDYARQFAAVFPDHAVTSRNMAAALATFERLIVSRSTSPFDRWVAGDETAIGADAKRGFQLFNGRARCAECHSGWAFTDGSFHDIGVATGDDLGRGRDFPNSVQLQYAFKTPTLRNVAERAPYMHDGSLHTLQDVIALYNRGGIDRPSRADPIRKLHLSTGDKADLIAFLHTLSGPVTAEPAPELPPVVADDPVPPTRTDD